MKKLIIIILAVVSISASAQNLTVNKLRVKDTVIMLNKGIKFSDGTYMDTGAGVGDTIWTKFRYAGNGYLKPKYATYSRVSVDSGYASWKIIWLKMNSTNTKYSYYIGKNGPPVTETGAYNNTFGGFAGYSLTGGGANNMFGYRAGESVYDGNSNNLFGAFAGNALTSGSSNLFLGEAAGKYLTTENNLIILNTLDQMDKATDTVFSPVFIRQYSDTADTKIWLNGNVNVRGDFTINGSPISPGGGDVSFSDTVSIIATKSDLLPYLLMADTTSFLHASDTASLLGSKTFIAGKYATLAGLSSYYLRSDTSSVLASKTFVAGKYATLAGLSSYYLRSDTASVLASKTFTAGKYATLAGLANYVLISDTASLVLGKTRASQIYETIANVSSKTDTASLLASKTFTAGKYATLAGLALKMNKTDTASLVYSQDRADELFQLKSAGGSSNWKDTLTAKIVPITNKDIVIKNGLYSASDGLLIFKYISNNIYVGDHIGMSGSTGNVIMGTYAGNNNSGSYNILIGENAGLNNGAAWYNIAIGARSLMSLNTYGSDYNTALGAFSGNTAGTVKQNLFLGYSSGRYLNTESYRIILNSLDRTNKAGDTTLSPVYIYQAPTTANQVLYLNGKTKISNQTDIGDGTNYVRLDTVSGLTLGGTATVWRDMSISGSALGIGAAAPSLRTFSGGIKLYAYNYQTQNDESYGNIQMQHDYKLQTDLSAHCHVSIEAAPSAGDTIVLWFEYTIADINENFTTTDTMTVKVPVATWTTNKHYYVDLGDITGSSITGVSAMINFRFMRKNDDPSDTYDNSNAFMFLHALDLHYQADALGSKYETTK